MSFKTCPNCGEEVPDVAPRCKSCFHDFTEQRGGRRGLVILAGFVSAMAVVGLSVMAWIFYFSSAEHIVVDAETQSIVITRTSAASEPTTERIPFSRVERIEHVVGGTHSTFEIAAVTTKGERYVIDTSDETPMLGDAHHLSAVIGKPVVEVKNIRGFGD